MTPNVIPQVNKYSLSLAETTKSSLIETTFTASVVPCSSVNVTQFNLTLMINANDNVFFNFIVVSIGLQPQNTWVDLFQHNLTNNTATNTLKSWQGTPRSQTANYFIASYTFFSNSDNLNYATFISSYSITTSTSAHPTIMEFSASTLSSSTIQVTIQIQEYIGLSTFSGFILVYNNVNIANNGGFFLYDYQNVTSAQNYNFQSKYPGWGARFDTKCIIGYRYFYFLPIEDLQLFFDFSIQSNYYRIKNTGYNTTNSLFYTTIFCLSNGKFECNQNASFYDSFTKGCYTASNCPVSTPDPGILPTTPQLCKLCSNDECIDCVNTNRNYCMTCNASMHAIAASGGCNCETGYYRPVKNCVLNCTYQIQGCKLANCTNETCCTQCDTGYHLYSVATCFQCKNCSLSIANCTQCTDQNLCTSCQSTFYLNTIDSTHANCSLCNSAFPYCSTCTPNSTGVSCTLCEPGYIHTSIACICSTVNLVGCVNCTIPTECVKCKTLYYRDPISKHCQLCTSLFQCTDCSAYNTCTACNQYYVLYHNSTDNSTQCIPCQSVIPNCKNCVPTFYCTECNTGFGVTTIQDCKSCKLLHPHCQLCDNYTVCTQCEANSYTFFINNTCITCSDVVSQCSACNQQGTQLVCTSCQSGYFLDPNLQACNLCSQYIDDCFSCKYNPLTLKPQCTECTSLFLVDTNFTCQKCKKDIYVTRTCSNVTGCSSSHLINGKLVCLSCDASLFFEYDESIKKCVCQKGFELLNSSQTCQQICGDSFVVQMECDDGNKINGDGCSDQCKIEDNFACTTSLMGLSSCILNENISVVYDYTLRQLGENKLSMYFTVSPTYTALEKVNWQKTITFNFSESIKPQFQYKDGILVITMEYSSDLDEKLMNLTIQFDSSIINSDPQFINFQMGAINGPLTYENESNLASYKVFGASGLIISLVCLFFYLISSYFHKMIGLETIQFIQIIYFVRLISGTSANSCFYAFNTLKYSNGYNDIISTSDNSPQDFKSIPSGFIKINLKLFFLENCNLMLIPVALAAIAYIFYLIKQSRSRTLYNETKEKIHKDLMIIQNRKIEWIYDSLIFSFTLSLLYVIVFSTLLYQLSISQSKSLFSSSFIILSNGINQIVLFVVCGIYCYQVILGIKKYNAITQNNENIRSEEKNLEHDGNGANHGFHPFYVSFYLMYQLMMILLMSVMIFINFKFLIETVLGFTTLYLVTISFWKPYNVNIHNIAIIFHQSTIIAFILFQLLSKYKLFPVVIINPFLYIILALILFALVFQLIRLYIHRKLSKKISNLEQTLQNQKNTEKNEMNKKKLVLNPYSHEAQILNLEGEISKSNYGFFPNERFLYQMMPSELANPSKKKIKSKSKMIVPIQLQDVNNQSMQQKSEDDYLGELQLKKYRLRQQLNIFYENDSNLNSYHNL